MGGRYGRETGNRSEWPGDPVKVTDHSGRSKNPEADCKKVDNVDEKKVNDQLKIGRDLGKWLPGNNCQSFVREVLGNASTAAPPDLAPFDDPMFWGY